jgi:hypothetical protein
LSDAIECKYGLPSFSPAAGLKSGQFDRQGNVLVSVKNSKSQITNNKQITIAEIQNDKPVWVIGY